MTKRKTAEAKAATKAAAKAAKAPMIAPPEPDAPPMNWRGVYAKRKELMTDVELRLHAAHEYGFPKEKLERMTRKQILDWIEDEDSSNWTIDKKNLIDAEKVARGDISAGR